jgi:hypothetical protein
MATLRHMGQDWVLVYMSDLFNADLSKIIGSAPLIEHQHADGERQVTCHNDVNHLLAQHGSARGRPLSPKVDSSRTLKVKLDRQRYRALRVFTISQLDFVLSPCSRRVL